MSSVQSVTHVLGLYRSRASSPGEKAAAFDSQSKLWRTCLAEVLFEEGEHFGPAVHCLLLAVCRSVVIEEAVAGAVVAVELVVLALLLQLFLVFINIRGRWSLVVIAEQPE